jgi:hypothetical protein
VIGQGIAVGSRLATERERSGRMPHVTPLGEGVTSDEARAALCQREEPTPQPVTAGPRLPEPLRPVAEAVEEIRTLRFKRSVNPEAVTRQEMARRVAELNTAAFPEERLARRTLAWRTIGVIPPDADLVEQVGTFARSTIIGYYDTLSKELVYVGTGDPSPYERVTLAHELTHALDDQHFRLARLDAIDARCEDDALIAGVAIAEGSARLIELIYIARELTPDEYAQYQQESLSSGSAPEGVSPFLINLLLFPYPYGQTFAQGIVATEGFDGLNGAMRTLPASTEQILHPNRFPEDEPRDVDIPDLAPALGDGWADLDVYDVGEAWLRLALSLKLTTVEASSAAAGWDGGEYRAWTNGDRTAVALQTLWDDERQAGEFAQSMRAWLARTASGAVTRVHRDRATVTVLWAPDEAALNAMTGAIRGQA